MSKFFVVDLSGTDIGKDLESLSPKVVQSLQLAINDTLRKTRTAAAASMERQINFPRGYLTGDDGRLGIAKFASASDLSGVIRGRDQPTSLARFVRGGAKPGAKEKGVVVEVDPGIAKRMPSAFAIQLKNNNVGLAYRTKTGKPPNSIGAKKLSEGLYLLYGPAVDQVFEKTRAEVAPAALDNLISEFNRLMSVQLK